MGKKYRIIPTIAILLLTVIASSSFPIMAVGQPERPLPVLLVHGYNEDSSVWQRWEQLLKQDGIIYEKVNFGIQGSFYDECGRAVDHAIDLKTMVQNMKSRTGQDKINIVGHSKGGLDARVYLDRSGTSDVANLIMIGTPNAGSPLADLFQNTDPCTPAILDFTTGAAATVVPPNPHTGYYTIAGNWNPFLISNCPFLDSGVIEGAGYWTLISNGYGLNDGIVPISRVESLQNNTSLGDTFDCHRNLTNKAEYDLAKIVLKPE